METIALLGIDLSKSVFQIHGVNQKGKAVMKRKLTRSKLIEFVAKLPKCVIAMEACGGANYFSRKFQSFGHEVKLLAPQFVKPFVKGNKNDAADAEAICEAASRPSMNFVSTKAIWQQDIQNIHRVRERVIKNRTALMNEIRGILYEYGIVIAQGKAALVKVIDSCLQGQAPPNSDLSEMTLEILQDLYSDFLHIEQSLLTYDKRIQKSNKSLPHSKTLSKVRGFGPLSTSILNVVLGDHNQFKNGRQFSSWLGLVPQHSGTGGKNYILGISKRGDKYIRQLLVHGARSVLQSVVIKISKEKKLDVLESWVHRLYLKKGWNKTALAIANKNARIAWSLVAKGDSFDPKKAAKAIEIQA